jgi:sugar (pentulose or hexulose) kinase
VGAALFETAVTLVLDVGKTRTKLLAIDADGSLLDHWDHGSKAAASAFGYQALDTAGVKNWLVDTMASLGPLRKSVRTIVPITHGAALAGVHDEALAFPVPDYEFEGFDERDKTWLAGLDPFEETLSPSLPLGLNLAVQLDWLERHYAQRAATVEQWMPYAQYWAWWLTGIASSELSSLGCHTQLWRPGARTWSELAVRRGWAKRFAPVRNAWDVIGTLRPKLARTLGLPENVEVLCGAHDSNACLARYLHSWYPMALVSSGTWVVVMAAGAPLTGVDGEGDFLANVSVTGEAVPTGRFMGGRDIERLCEGADPRLADADLARALLNRGARFASGATAVTLGGDTFRAGQLAQRFDARERASLAALYAAKETLACLRKLDALGPVVVEGPLASNDCFIDLLAANWSEVHVSMDAVEGTARGGFALSRWSKGPAFTPKTRRISQSRAAALC